MPLSVCMGLPHTAHTPSMPANLPSTAGLVAGLPLPLPLVAGLVAGLSGCCNTPLARAASRRAKAALTVGSSGRLPIPSGAWVVGVATNGSLVAVGCPMLAAVSLALLVTGATIAASYVVC